MTETGTGPAVSVGPVDMKLEVVVIPVLDTERARDFYARLGWRQDQTPTGSGIVQFTPHGSGCSVQFGGNRGGNSGNQSLIQTGFNETPAPGTPASEEITSSAMFLRCCASTKASRVG